MITDCAITYGNGANVNTSFVHNLDQSVLAENAPDLYEAIAACPSQSAKKAQRVICLPRNVLRQSSIGRLSHTPFRLERSEAIFVRSAGGYDIFGGGLLVSDAAAERQEQALEAERAERAEIIHLTQTEERMLEHLNERQRD